MSGRLLGRKITVKKNKLEGKFIMEEKLTYEEAMAQLQQLVVAIEEPDAQIAGIGKELKRAMELIEFCKKELDGYEKDFNTILNRK